MIEQGIQAGKGAQRRLTLAPGKSTNWLRNESDYCPSMQGGKQKVSRQIANDIKCHLFSFEDSTIQLGELADACDGL
jgi:hypothetical protein